MASSVVDQKTQTQTITVEDVNRLLEVGHLLFSVLTPEEIEALARGFCQVFYQKK